jgi:nucleotide-binding universal stress UspA family protein
MTDDRRPVLVAFDGSAEAKAAAHAAAELFPDRRLVVATVWEPGLAMAMAATSDVGGAISVAPTVEEIDAIDRAQHDRASDAAEAGARLARDLGATAEPLPVADEADVADTLVAIAERIDAAAVVVGSRGLGAFKSGLFGSTSHRLLRRLERPVLVVKARD